ncbi:hypothetical protein CH63R_14566 [Colletotrichum higginsianum IMI 349063]|uniref:Ubiquitin-like protease family profile domain-containing protein n=1 Tax=Colletotrichum higginsianum (strain IMI 349063) TaxID=759273 RepID=A0A1B7XQI7_COLHI|nr:hypothetical protein CH63R_14566 [Colletotrichum higginsianum IMI 349063]OBR01994.1 hypothetical protein CH63R_14566 [Colletotrichum higginsianum IMI 349063]
MAVRNKRGSPRTRLPRSAYTRASQITATLKILHRQDGPYVHERQISFKTGRTKDFWDTMLLEPEHRDHLSAFLKAPKSGKKCWVGFFSCPQSNWVGTGNAYKSADWHCFAVLIISDERCGKHLLLYDNDAKAGVTTSSRISDVIWGLQKNLWTSVQKMGRFTLWYSTDQSKAGTNKCLRYSLEQVHRWSELKDETLQTERDLRLTGFIKLTKP